jgi:hypothetical protein
VWRGGYIFVGQALHLYGNTDKHNKFGDYSNDIRQFLFPDSADEQYKKHVEHGRVPTLEVLLKCE